MMLIPLYGLYGAALAITLAMIFEAAARDVVASRRLGRRLFIMAKAPAGPTGAGSGEGEAG